MKGIKSVYYEPGIATKYGLTRRQLEVLGCYMDGAENRAEVADILHVSESCIATHLRRIYRALNVITVHGAVCKMIREGKMIVRQYASTEYE